MRASKAALILRDVLSTLSLTMASSGDRLFWFGWANKVAGLSHLLRDVPRIAITFRMTDLESSQGVNKYYSWYQQLAALVKEIKGSPRPTPQLTISTIKRRGRSKVMVNEDPLLGGISQQAFVLGAGQEVGRLELCAWLE